MCKVEEVLRGKRERQEEKEKLERREKAKGISHRPFSVCELMMCRERRREKEEKRRGRMFLRLCERETEWRERREV